MGITSWSVGSSALSDALVTLLAMEIRPNQLESENEAATAQEDRRDTVTPDESGPRSAIKLRLGVARVADEPLTIELLPLCTGYPSLGAKRIDGEGDSF